MSFYVHVHTARSISFFYPQVLQDWKYVASVIDRVQLVIFVTVTIFVTIGLLLNAPYILEYVDQDEIIKKYSNSQ